MKEKKLINQRGTVFYLCSTKILPQRKTLVFLHGLTADHTLFDKQTECFDADYNLIVWDAPAHGKSRPYKNFTYPNMADDLRQLLLENSITSAIMIGQSMGGFVIQSFLQRYPEMVEAFIGIDTCPYGERYYSRSDKWWLRQIEWMSRCYPEKQLKKAIAKQCSRTRYAYENMLCAIGPYGKEELCHLMGIGFAELLEDNKDMEIKCPVLLICGEHDKTGKAKAYNKEWAAHTGFPLVWIKDAAHNSNADNPKAVNSAIAAFINRL